jgi:hypothetical protein
MHPPSDNPLGSEEERGRGLWLLPSHINHRCVFNVHRYFVGDLMFLRTSTDVRAGTELTMAYLANDIPVHERQKELERRDFTCSCHLCQYETKMYRDRPELAHKRARILETFRRGKPLVGDEVTLDAKALLERTIQAIYQVHREYAGTFGPITAIPKATILDIDRVDVNIPNPPPPLALVIDLFEPLVILGCIDVTPSNLLASTMALAESYWLARACPSSGRLEVSVGSTIQIAGYFASIGDGRRARKWIREGQRLFDMFYGGGSKYWRVRYPGFAEILRASCD